VLEVKLAPLIGNHKAWSISDLLESTADDVITFLKCFPKERSAIKAVSKLQLLSEVGLGYLSLGQPINTLSGGESQRLKLVRSLAESQGKITVSDPTLFLFDEPTTGLHFDDIRLLSGVLHRLVDEGHSVIVVEHNLDMIRQADWIIDLGPEAGDAGGQLVAEGSPEKITKNKKSKTAKALLG